MLSSLLRSKNVRRAPLPFSLSSPYASPTAEEHHRPEVRYAAADWMEDDVSDDESGPLQEQTHGPQDDEEDEEEGEGEGEGGGEDSGDDEDDHNEDGNVDVPLLPLFSAAHLGTS